MLLFLLPPVVQVVIGAIVLVIGVVALHSVIVVAVGAVGLAVGGYRWTRSRKKGGYRR